MPNLEAVHLSVVGPFTNLRPHKSLPQSKIPRQTDSNNRNTRFAPPNVSKDDTATPSTRQAGPPPLVDQARPSGLPPTPPMHSQDVSAVGSDVTTAASQKKQFRKEHIISHSELSTPVNPRSPPTPDSTPPREQEKILGLQPPMTLRNLSSRTDSFKTAREDQPPSESEVDGAEDVSDDLTPLAQAKQLKIGLDRLHHEVNSGSTDEDKTPTAERAWLDLGTSDANMNAANRTKDWTHRTADDMALTIPKRSERRSASFSALPDDTPDTVLADTVSTDLKSDLHDRIGSSLRDRIERNRENADRPSTLRFADEIAWPTTMLGLNLDEDDRLVDNKRLSGISTSSTIIEAYVVDIDTPRRRQTLRHVGKNVNLRARKSSAPAVVTSSEITWPPRHRLVHKKSNEDMKRASMASDHSPILDPKGETSPILTEHIPVMIISQERPKMFTGRPESIPTVVSDSSGSQPNKRADEGGYFDLPLRKKKMVVGVQRNAETGHVFSNSSGYSTLTMINNHHASGTTSLMPAADESDAKTHLKRATNSRTADSAMNERRPQENPHVGATYLCTSTTPYSPLSTNSTTEALEVSEATAVSIHPHHNNSLLLVQQQPPPLSLDTDRALVGAMPTRPQTSAIETPVDSPSQTAQGSPQPPALQIIPPTPDVLSPTGDDDRQLGGQVNKSGIAGKTLKRVKRALSPRRYSDSFLSPFNLFKGVDESAQTNGNHHRRRHSIEEVQDSNLSPFWRPRGFWDDLEVSDEDLRDEFLDRGRIESFERPVSRRGHRSDDDEVDEDSYSRLRRYSTESPAARRRAYRVPAYVGWKGLYHRLKDNKAAKKSKAKDRERERFKGGISFPTAIDPAMV
ncbi:MAG: hypothetical protein M1816_000341 [Peltula sp. TS41687]|nr:MAG: hypothetical protein M1816_000341 [Peltula sp. TS41687]